MPIAPIALERNGMAPHTNVGGMRYRPGGPYVSYGSSTPDWKPTASGVNAPAGSQRNGWKPTVEGATEPPSGRLTFGGVGHVWMPLKLEGPLSRPARPQL